MPRPEYKTITVKKNSFQSFMKAKKGSKLENSEFIDELVKLYKKNGKNSK